MRRLAWDASGSLSAPSVLPALARLGPWRVRGFGETGGQSRRRPARRGASIGILQKFIERRAEPPFVASDKFIHINRPLMDERETQAVLSVMESGVLTSPAKDGGPSVQKLEKAVREFTGARYAVAVNSGTAALQASLLSLGVGKDDEVIVPSFSYVATANAVRSVGARPVFADIGEDLTMDPASASSLVTGRTAAVIPVHLYGRVADIPAISEAAGDARIIEDAAQSLGSTINGRHTGTLAGVGCYSLYPGKVATAGEGGVIVTDDGAIHQSLLAVRNHGNTGSEFERFGVNLRMPEISAAIGAVQVDKLPAFLDARRRNAALLSDLLKETGLVLPAAGKEERPNWGLYTVMSDRRDALLDSLARRQVGAAVYYRTPIHMTPYYHHQDGRRLPATERAARLVLSLPVHPGVTGTDIERIAGIISGTVRS